MILSLNNPFKRSAFKAILGGVAGFSFYTSFYQNSKYKEKQANMKRIQENVDKFEPVELKGKHLVTYPWIKDGQFKKWEYKLVKIMGYFKEERFFVRRDRNGKDGYLVFAPFVTAISRLEHNMQKQSNPNAEISIFVNLGWVPLENKGEIEKSSEPVPLIEFEDDEKTGYKYNIHTEMKFGTDVEDDDDVQQLTYITGLVRRGEDANVFQGRKNWQEEGVFQWIDLNFMARYFRFLNISGASKAYIERIVPDYDSEESEIYPVPSNKQNFEQSVLSPQKNYDYSLFWGSTSLVSLISFLTLSFLKR